MIARDYFYADAYRRKEEERTKWEKEVIEEYINSQNNIPSDLKELHNIFDTEEKKHSNTNIYEMIINTYLLIEKNQKIKDIVDKCWIGNWDSPEYSNAIVMLDKFYDGSHLIRVTTELQMDIRRTSELVAIVLYYQLASSGEFDNASISIAARLAAICLHDIKNDLDLYVESAMPLISEGISDVYNTVFGTTFIAAMSFVVFHEVGHLIEKEKDIADTYGLKSSCSIDSKIERMFLSEWNADAIAIMSVKKIFYEDNPTRWMAVTGVLIVFVTLSIISGEINIDTDHPALSKRYKKAKELLFMELDKNEVNLVNYHINFVCSLLQEEGYWNKNEWKW
ncbi:MAG: hypothetical protein ACI4EX_13725 [Lachnospiraceae bacterium]